MNNYCERNYKMDCNECSLCNYNHDCHNNEIGKAGKVSLARCRAEDAERKASGFKADKYGNKYITPAEANAFFGF